MQGFTCELSSRTPPHGLLEFSDELTPLSDDSFSYSDSLSDDENIPPEEYTNGTNGDMSDISD